MRNPAGPLAAAVFVAMLAFIPAAAAGDVATINACLKTEHDANTAERVLQLRTWHEMAKPE